MVSNNKNDQWKKLTAFDFKSCFIISWWLSKTAEKQQISVKQTEEEHTCNRHLQKTRRACESYSNDINGEIEFLLIKKKFLKWNGKKILT
jgi:hypothetical protein